MRIPSIGESNCYRKNRIPCNLFKTSGHKFRFALHPWSMAVCLSVWPRPHASSRVISSRSLARPTHYAIPQSAPLHCSCCPRSLVRLAPSLPLSFGVRSHSPYPSLSLSLSLSSPFSSFSPPLSSMNVRPFPPSFPLRKAFQVQVFAAAVPVGRRKGRGRPPLSLSLSLSSCRSGRLSMDSNSDENYIERRPAVP